MAPRPFVLEGPVWPIVGALGTLLNDVDTDQIYHNAHLAVTDVDEMGQYAFGNLAGWEDFPKKVRPGDILAVGGNFGAGSSRQHAVDCFRALGVAGVVGASFGAIYKRNAVNAGWPLLECPRLADLELAPGDVLKMNLETGEVANVTKAKAVPARPFSRVQMDIYLAGDLFAYGAKLGG
jgi:3-isopropylmalate/(R)-2-methylmalate dehydratase small subunit